ncbi:unnamed protein product [Penicillium salamii]|nr:unnamed protein product [Penicillium salamii]
MGDYTPDTESVNMPRSSEKQLDGLTSQQSSGVLYHQLHREPLSVIRGRGSYLVTNTGLEILDATCGAAVSCLGHSDERVHEAIIDQLKKIPYCYSLYFTNAAAENLSKLLVESTGGVMSRAYIVSSGTEAVEAAVKMAIQYFTELPVPEPRRVKFISRHSSYHGNTLGSLAVGHHASRRRIYESLLSQNISHVPQCYPYRGMKLNEATEDYVARLAQELEDEFQRVGPNTVAAFVAETMPGATLGCVPPLPGYLKALKAVCERHGALFILDEVMSGMGRTGTLHAWEQEDVVPDLQTIAKGLGAGYAPIAGLLINRHVVDTLNKGTGAFVHSQTYQGHPVACAAAYRVQQIIQEDNLLPNVREMGEYLGRLLHERLDKHPHVGDIRGRGLFWAMEFVQDRETKESYPPSKALSWTLHTTGLKPEYAISLMPGSGGADGVNGDHIILAPPYNTTQDEIRMIVDRTVRVIEEVLGCLQCRQKHNKCEEQHPTCSFCASRNVKCTYPSGLKWAQPTKSMETRHKPRTKHPRVEEQSLIKQPSALFTSTHFESAEEKSAWEYYVRMVSTNVPALDGPENPYRQLSIPALSSPILLETIVCISTEHMLNFGLASVDLAAKRQQRMLRTLGQKLLSLDSTPSSDTIVIEKSEREALLIAVVLQGIVVAQSADGVLEPHVKCASWLMQALGYFESIPQNPIARMAIQRYGMVDVMLAISRQRRPYAPQNFILSQPDQHHWDETEPSFHKMTGCPQPLMCFLVRIAHLACDVTERPGGEVLSEAFQLDTELRSWGSRYTGILPARCDRTLLDILTECFYWTAHLLLARRVFQDQTCSPRVQYLVHVCFRLMDHLATGCGPDSSLPQPFYLAAREAVSAEDRVWVRQKHESMTAFYREQQRNAAMVLIERIWETTDALRQLERGSLKLKEGVSLVDGAIQTLDREANFFIF